MDTIIFGELFTSVVIDFKSTHNVWLSRLIEVAQQYAHGRSTDGTELTVVISRIKEGFPYLLRLEDMAAFFLGNSPETGKQVIATMVFPTESVSLYPDEKIDSAQEEADAYRQYEEQLMMQAVIDEEVKEAMDKEIVDDIDEAADFDMDESVRPDFRDAGSRVDKNQDGFRLTDRY